MCTSSKAYKPSMNVNFKPRTAPTCSISWCLMFLLHRGLQSLRVQPLSTTRAMTKRQLPNTKTAVISQLKLYSTIQSESKQQMGPSDRMSVQVLPKSTKYRGWLCPANSLFYISCRLWSCHGGAALLGDPVCL